jgi:NDP-sugar pyrophosphorylase family protein
VPRSVERDIYPALLAEHAPVYGIAPGGFWMDVGRPEHLLEASIAVLTRRVQTAIPGIARAASAEVAPTATLSESTAIGPGCRIAEGARLTDCVVFDGVSVGECAVLTGVVIDSGSVIGDNVVIEARAGSTTAPVIASGSHLARGSRIIMG